MAETPEQTQALSSIDDPDANETPGMPREILDSLPPEARKKVAEISLMMQQSGPMPHPLTQKITPQHIDKALDLAARQEDNQLANQRSARRYMAFYTAIGIGAFLWLTWFLVAQDRAVYLEVLKFLAVFVGGFGGGYGVKSHLDKG